MAATYDDGFEYRHTAPRAAPLQQQQAFLPPPIPTEFAPLPFDNSPMPDSRNTRHSSYGMPSSRDSGYGAGYNGFLSASQQQDISSPHAGNSSRRHSTLRSDVTKGPIRRFFAAYKTRNQASRSSEVRALICGLTFSSRTAHLSVSRLGTICRSLDDDWSAVRDCQ